MPLDAAPLDGAVGRPFEESGGEPAIRPGREGADLDQPEDLKAYAEALPALAAGGMQIPVSWAHEKLRIPQAAEGEAVFGAAPAPESPIAPPGRGAGGEGPPAAGRARRAALAALAAADTTDPADQLTGPLADAAQPAVDAWLADIERLLADNPDLTPTEVQQRLLAMFGDLPTDQLVEIMAQGYQLAMLAGIDDIDEGR